MNEYLTVFKCLLRVDVNAKQDVASKESVHNILLINV